jgi:hypothetical protein
MPLFGRGKLTSSQFTTAIRAGKCLHLESDSDHIVCRKTFALAVFARVLRAFSPMLVQASLPQLPEFLQTWPFLRFRYALQNRETIELIGGRRRLDY